MTTILLCLALAAGPVSGPARESYSASAVNSTGSVSTALHLKDDLGLYLGTGDDYWLVYDSGDTRWEFWSATGGMLAYVDDGTDDWIFVGSTTLAGATMTGDLDAGAERIVYTEPADLVPAADTQTVDWATGAIQTVDLGSATGDVTLTFSNPPTKSTFLTLYIIQGATARDVVYPATVLWPADAAPVPTATDNALDMQMLAWNGTNYIGSFQQDIQ